MSAVLVVIIYLVDDLTVVAKIPPMMLKALRGYNNNNNNNNMRYPRLCTCLWFCYLFFVVFFLMVCVLRIVEIIFTATSVVDALTVGISFIILIELDNKIYDQVKQYNLKGEKLFQIELLDEDIKGTMYSFISPELYDVIVLWTAAISSIFTLVFIPAWGDYGWSTYLSIFIAFAVIPVTTMLILCLRRT